MATPGQVVFGRDMLFKITSVVEWLVVTASKQRQVEIYKFRENGRLVMHDYAIGNLLYVEITRIYQKLGFKKQGPYIITEVIKNGTV